MKLLAYVFDPVALGVGALIALLGGLLVQSYGQFIRRWLDGIDARRLTKRLEKDKYTPSGFKKAALDGAKIYVRPDCQDSDPSAEQGEAKRRSMFHTMDDLLGPPLKSKCIFLLADSGMGKSEFLQQYYRYHWESERMSIRFSLIVVPLNSSQANELIMRVPLAERDDVVLFLDALDEDNAAIGDLNKRFHELIDLTKGFRAVLITCRTQFLAEDKGLPVELDIPIVEGPLGLNDGPDRKIIRLYLSRLSKQQVGRYICERFRLLTHPIYRYRAWKTAERFSDLIARPLILTFVQDLITEKSAPKYSYEVYQIILEAWLKREEKKKRLASSRDDLLRFSELFAGRLFFDGVPGLHSDLLRGLAEDCSIKLSVAEIRERSLLIYVDGYWRFSHRSIMEYLLVRDVEKSPKPPLWMKSERPWTDLMQMFAWEMTLNNRKLPYARVDKVPLKKYELKGVDFSKLRLDGANASGVDFREAIGLTITHAASVRSNKRTLWPVEVLKGHKDDVTCCALAANEEIIVTGSRDRTIKFWELKTGRLVRSQPCPESGIVTCCATGYTGDVCAVGIGSTLFLCSRTGGFRKNGLRGSGGHITSCSAVPGGNSFVSGSVDSTLTVWDADSGIARRTLKGLEGKILCCAVASEAMLVAAGSSNGTVGIWDLNTGDLLNKLTVHNDEVDCCAINTTGSVLVSGSRDRTVRKCDPRTDNSGRVIGRHEFGIYSCALLAQQGLVVTGSTETMQIWDCKTGALCTILHGHSNRVVCCATNSRENLLVSGSLDKTIRIWFS